MQTGVQHQRQHQRPEQKEDLPAEELRERPTLGPGKLLAADCAQRDVAEVIEQPLRRQQRVEKPDVDVLVALPRVAGLRGRQPAERLNVDVGVKPRTVRVAVVEHVVLPGPDVRAGSDEVERAGHHAVHPRLTRVRAVTAVVHDVEADAGHREADRHGADAGLPPGVRAEQAVAIRSDQPGEDDHRLEAHAQRLLWQFATVGEVRVNTLMHRSVKRPMGQIARLTAQATLHTAVSGLKS